MLITSLLPLLHHYSLGFDLVAGPDQTVTLTVLPRKAEGAKNPFADGELRPVSITGTATEIDEELAKGPDGALGQLIAARKTLAEQIAEQRLEAEQAKAAAAAKAKPATTPAKPAEPEKPAAQAQPPAAAIGESKPGEPASLW